MSLTCRTFPYGSPDYTASLALREAVLRKPLGLDWELDAFDGEGYSFHLGAFSDDRLLGCLILKPTSATHLKMRQVAVSPDTQGHGIGTKLVIFAEEFARHSGYRQITAHARDTAIPFYRKLGYAIIGASFLELSIPHYLISKDLP